MAPGVRHCRTSLISQRKIDSLDQVNSKAVKIIIETGNAGSCLIRARRGQSKAAVKTATKTSLKSHC